MLEHHTTCTESGVHRCHHMSVQVGERHLNVANAAHATSKAGPKVATAQVGEILQVAHIKVLVGACLILLILVHPFVPVHL